MFVYCFAVAAASAASLFSLLFSGLFLCVCLSLDLKRGTRKRKRKWTCDISKCGVCVCLFDICLLHSSGSTVTHARVTLVIPSLVSTTRHTRHLDADDDDEMPGSFVTDSSHSSLSLSMHLFLGHFAPHVYLA